MRKQQLGRVLQLAFFPIIACALLAGHASGQTPVRIMPFNDSITGSFQGIKSGETACLPGINGSIYN